MPGEKLFENAVECGHFVKRFVGRLAEEVATGVLGERCPVLAECLFVNTKSTNTTIASNDTSTPMVDNEGQANIQKQISETSVSLIPPIPCPLTISFPYVSFLISATIDC